MQIDKEIVEKIRNLPTPAIVAISGFGGSGKSTAAHTLAEILHAPVISVDQFGIDRSIEDYTHWKGMDFGRLEKEILIPFYKGENPVRYGHWDHAANTVVKTVDVPHSGLLIIEGVGLFRPELSKYLTYKIWLDVPQHIANARGKKRDREVHKNPQDEKWDDPWKRNDEEYFSEYKPKEMADVVISNS
jgi:uridine kinase